MQYTPDPSSDLGGLGVGMRWLGTALIFGILWAPTAYSGTCGADATDCDGDGLANEVDRCPFTASNDNRQTTVTYAGSTERLPTGMACTDLTATVQPTARLGWGVELGADVAVLQGSTVGDYAILGGSGESAVVGRRGVLVDAPTPEQGIVFRSGVIGGASNVGVDTRRGPSGLLEGSVTTGIDVSIGRAASVGYGVELGDQVVIGYGAVVGANSVLRDGVIIGSLVQIGDGVTVSQNSAIARHVSIGDGAWIGPNTVLAPEVQVGEGARVGGMNSGANPVKVRKGVVVGRCADIEPGARVGRQSQIGAYATVGAGSTLRFQMTLADGGTVCAGSGTRNGQRCRANGLFTGRENIAGDPSNRTCPQIAVPGTDVDLVVDTLQVTSSLPIGFSASVEVVARNVGADRSAASSVSLAWSPNGAWTTPAACEADIRSLAAGQAQALALSCTAPSSPGSVRLVARVDADELVAEVDETNNDRPSAVVTILRLDQACGAAQSGNSPSAPTSQLCGAGEASRVAGSGPFTWSCTDGSSSAVASCSSDRECSAAGQNWSVSGNSCTSNIARGDHSGALTVTDSALPTTGSRAFQCDQGSWVGQGAGTCVTANDGACGAAANGNTTSAPVTGLCGAGRASSVSGSGPYRWTCSGADGGDTASCQSARSCLSTSTSWAVGGSSCSATVASLTNGQSASVSDGGLPTTGAATVQCAQGALQVGAGASCVTAVNARCGASNGSSNTQAPSTNLCSVGGETSVSGSGPYRWTCRGLNGGTNASCSANRSCSGIGQSWSVSGSSCSANVSAVGHSGSRTATDSGLPTTGSRSYNCSQGSWSGQGSGSCVTAGNGRCGPANGGSTSDAPSSGARCSSGTPSGVSGSGPYRWSCSGSNGGSTVSCSSNRSCSGTGQTWSVSGASCSGSVSSVSHSSSQTATDRGLPTTGSRSYSCSQGSWAGQGTGSCVTAGNGSCGTANGGSTTSAPSTSARCRSGSPSGISGSGPYRWTCSGSNGGSSASCSSNRSCSGIGQSWSVSGSSCSANVSTASHSASQTATDRGLPTTGSRSYSCSQGSWAGQGTGSCVTAGNGSCGTANGGSTTSAPSTSSRCRSGSPSGISGSG
ncbi:MAG: UDP-3-O-[3-hydroxymyristoyl] glucosamine N-acyltransferase, partial [Myxococcota bacterium]